MKERTYSIRNMTREEVADTAIKWAEKEGWNPGLYDLESFYQTDPKGFFVGLLGSEPIACISAIAYDNDFAFVGFYIVKPEYRGKGYGLKIWNEALVSLKTNNAGLDGVLTQQPNYKKSGFKFAYSNIRFEGKAQQTNQRFNEIVKLAEVSFQAILDYDKKLFPVPREKFLKLWLEQPESLALIAINDGKVAGYSLIRKCSIGYKIGPLFADNKVLADKLFVSFANFIEPGTSIFLDTPEVNLEAVALAEIHGMKKVFETARMYTKSQPKIDLNKVFGVTTFELG
ncbi:MAG: GNAT family N-acetyltransferase [Lentisphaerota bacterium]